MPHRSQPLHFSGATTWGAWYPLELNAEESASTFVGQNSTQKPQALQRSTVIETVPFAAKSTPTGEEPPAISHYRQAMSARGVTWVTVSCEADYTASAALYVRPALRPNATRNTALLPAAWGEKNFTTSSS